MSEEPGTSTCHKYNSTGLLRLEEAGHAPRAWALVACHWRTSERAYSTGSGAPGGMRVSCTQPTAARPGAVTTVAMLLGLSASGFFNASTAMPIAVCMRHALYYKVDKVENLRCLVNCLACTLCSHRTSGNFMPCTWHAHYQPF